MIGLVLGTAGMLLLRSSTSAATTWSDLLP